MGDTVYMCVGDVDVCMKVVNLYMALRSVQVITGAKVCT